MILKASQSTYGLRFELIALERGTLKILTEQLVTQAKKKTRRKRLELGFQINPCRPKARLTQVHNSQLKP